MAEDGCRLSTSRVAIIGLGLMGASLAMDLRGHCAEILGASRSPETLKFALDRHIVNRVTEFGTQMDCELMVLAAPVRTILQQLDQLRELPSGSPLKKPMVILDLGSTKTEIVKAMRALPERYDPIGGHPMCGKEVSGIRQAEPGLYREKTFVLTPLERSSSQALELVNELIETIGAEPLLLSPEKQDELVAMTSHLPYLAASALMKTAISKDDPLLWQVAASGFRDTTRLAASDLTMMMDILLTNREAILNALNAYQDGLNQLAILLRDGNEAGLRDYLNQTQKIRSGLF